MVLWPRRSFWDNPGAALGHDEVCRQVGARRLKGGWEPSCEGPGMLSQWRCPPDNIWSSAPGLRKMLQRRLLQWDRALGGCALATGGSPACVMDSGGWNDLSDKQQIEAFSKNHI